MDRARTIVVSAPGKIILHGEHAVVYGKKAVAASLNLRTFLRLKVADSDTVCVALPDIGLESRWTTHDLQEYFPLPFCDPEHPIPPSHDLLQNLMAFADLNPDTTDTKQLAVVAFLYTYLSICYNKGRDCKLPGVEIYLTSKLPTGAGLGSSAAFSVSLVTSFLLLCQRVTSKVSIDDKDTGVWNPADLELINNWSFISEKIIHGKPSGIDNTVSAYGGALNFQEGKITPLCSIPSLRVMLFDTKVPRSTKVLVAGVREKYTKYPAVIGAIFDSIGAISETCQDILKVNKDISTENGKSLEDLIEINQHLLRALGVSHPTLEKVCQITAKYKLCCKLTGAGGGGCAFTLLAPDFPDASIKGIQVDMELSGFNCFQTSIGSIGVVEHYKVNKEKFTPPDNFTL